VAPTRARVAWNEEGLYLGFTCDGFDADQFESQPDSLRKRNRLRLVISNDASGTMHHRLDFDMNGFVAMFFDEGKTRTWNKSYIPEEVPVGVAAFGDGQWTAECFVPWGCIGGRPGPNTERRANLIRSRPSPYEYTSWSPQIEPNLWDVEHLGRWQFRGGE